MAFSRRQAPTLAAAPSSWRHTGLRPAANPYDPDLNTSTGDMMASWQSLLACAQADVTMERIASLAAITGTEPLTVDFKEKANP